MSTHRITLKTALIVPFVIISVAGIITSWLISYYFSLQETNKMVSQIHRDTTLRINEHLSNFIGTPHLINQINASNMHERRLDTTDQEQLERYFWHQIRMFPSVTSIYFGNTDGGLVNSGREGAEGSQYIINTIGFKKGLFRKYATDELGNPTGLLATVPDFDARKRLWYQGAVKKKAAYWSPVYFLYTGQDMAIAESLPVYDSKDVLLGVVSVDVFLSHLSNFLSHLEVCKTGEAFIIEPSGYLIASSTNEKPFIQTPGQNAYEQVKAIDSSEITIHHAAATLNWRFGNLHRIKQTEEMEFKIRGDKYFLQVSPFHDDSGLDWLIVIVFPESDLLAHAHATNRIAFALILMILLITLVLGIIISNKISRPVIILNEATQMMENGHLADPIRIDTRLHELSLLLQSFNNMSEKLRMEKDLCQGVLNALTDTVLVLDSETKLPVVWNKALSMISGYSDEEINAKQSITYLFDSQSLSQARHKLKNIETCGAFIIETEFLTHYGSRIPMEYCVSTFVTTLNPRRLIVAVGRNITERKKAEIALRDRECELSLIFENAPAAMVIIDKDNRLIKSNKAMNYMGERNRQSEGLRFGEVLHCIQHLYNSAGCGQGAACKTCGIRNAVLDTILNRISHFQEEHALILFRNGENHTVHLIVSSIPIDTGAGHHALIMLEDITQKKQAEADREQMQQQLFQSQKLESIGLLAGGMAHEFNNILTVIMGNAELLKLNSVIDMYIQDELEAITNAVDRAKVLTMQLLTFARKEKINIQKVSISNIIKSLLSIFQFTKFKNIQTHSVIHEDTFIEGDINQITQALLNLCNNAAEAMSNGGDLTIECSSYYGNGEICETCGHEISGSYCNIRISDTGKGIPEDIINRVLEPFFTTKTVGKGPGLGLSVAIGIITNHNGHMRIISQQGEGTCVHVYLPLSTALEVKDDESGETRSSRKCQETILVIDDEKMLLPLIERILNHAGYRTLLSYTGIEAINLYRENQDQIDLVILDMIMPQMNGVQVWDELKRINPDSKVVISSGYSINGQVEELLKDGVKAFIQKPFNADELLKIIRDSLDN